MNRLANNRYLTLVFHHPKLIELLFFIIAAGIFIFYNVILPDNHRGDLAVFYFAGSTVTGQFHLQPDDLYDAKNRRAILRRLVRPLSGTQFLYPPQSALLFAPLTFIPYRSAEKLWDWFNAIAVIAAYVVTIRFLLYDRFLRMRYSLLLAFLAFAPPIEKLFDTGQINGIILLLLIAGMVALLKKRHVTSGVFIGIAATIKIFPLFFLLYFIVRKSWKAALAMMASLALFFFSALPLFGWKTMATDFINIQRDIILRGDLGSITESTSLFGSFRTAVKNGTFDAIAPQVTHPRKYIVSIGETVHRVGTTIAFLLVIGTIWYARKQNTPQPLLFDYATIILFILLFSKSIHTAFHLFVLPFILFFLHFPLQRKYIIMHGIGIIVLILTHFANILPFFTRKGFATLGLFILFCCVMILYYQPRALLWNDRLS